METHQRTCYYQRGQKPQYKPRPKHPVKVHMWVGISRCGHTMLCISKERWMHHYLFPFSIIPLCPSSMLCTLMDIDSCRIMTPSIVRRWQRPTTRRMASTDGPLHLNHQISTQLRTFGMSLRSTYSEKSNQRQSKSWYMALGLSGQLWQLPSAESTLVT